MSQHTRPKQDDTLGAKQHATLFCIPSCCLKCLAGSEQEMQLKKSVHEEKITAATITCTEASVRSRSDMPLVSRE